MHHKVLGSGAADRPVGRSAGFRGFAVAPGEKGKGSLSGAPLS